MALKGAILEGHIPVNKYQLIFLGLPPLTITKLSGLEEELDTTEMPDRTIHSNGQTKPLEMTIEIPMHHVIEQQAMEAWFSDCKDPVAPGYKKDRTLLHLSSSLAGLPSVFSVNGAFIKGRKTPEMDMSNDSDAAVVEWTLSIDDVSPI